MRTCSQQLMTLVPRPKMGRGTPIWARFRPGSFGRYLRPDGLDVRSPLPLALIVTNSTREPLSRHFDTGQRSGCTKAWRVWGA